MGASAGAGHSATTWAPDGAGPCLTYLAYVTLSPNVKYTNSTLTPLLFTHLSEPFSVIIIKAVMETKSKVF